MSTRRLVRLATAAALVVLAGPASLPAHAACPVIGQFAPEPDGWQRIVPPFTSLSGAAFDPAGGVIAAWVQTGDSAAVAVSTDGGCRWAQPTLALPADPVLQVDGPFTPVALYFAGSALVAVGNVGLHPYAVASSDSGRTWQRDIDGLPAAGTIRGTAVVGDAVYAVVETTHDTGVLGGNLLYARATSGTWRLVSGSAPQYVGGPTRGADVPAQVATVAGTRSRLWAAAANGLFGSDDGGATWRAVGSADGAYDVVAATGTKAVATGYRSDAGFAATGSGGTKIAVPPGVAVAAYLPDGRVLLGVREGTSGLYALRPDRPGDLVRLRGGAYLSIDVTAAGTYATTRAGIYRIHTVPLKPPDEIIPPVVANIAVCPYDTATGFAAPLPPGTLGLRAARPVVDLPAGGTTTVDVGLRGQGAARRLDVLFVVDSTGSMFDAICGLRRSLGVIATSLARAGVDAYFGLADFKDWPGNGNPTSSGGDYPYRLRVPLGPLTPSLGAQFAKLDANGGADSPESQLTALSAAASHGALGPRSYLRPQQFDDSGDPGWRSGARRVAVLVTDSPFHDPERDVYTGYRYPGPTWAQTVAALRAADVAVVGIGVGGMPDDVVRIAGESGATAARPTDCNGDGVGDIPAGRPLVCEVTRSFPPRGLGRPVLSLVGGLPDRRALGLTARASGPATATFGSVPSAVDLAAAPADVPLTVACPTLPSASVTTVDLRATAGPGRGPGLSGDARVAVRCAPAAPPVDPVLPRPAAAVAVPPAPPQLVYAGGLQPVANAQAQQLPQPQVHQAGQAVTGIVPQDETRTAVAEELAMSRLASPVATWLGCAAVLATAYAVRRRTRTAPVYVRR